MDQTIIKDNHYMTREFLESQLVQNKTRITELEEHISRVTQRDYKTAGTLVAMRDGMQEWTMNALEQSDITETAAEEIAEICGFELTKEVEVEVTVTYNLTVNVGPNQDVESIVGDIDFDTVQYNDDSISWMSSSVDSVDF